jgi:hypothetical protein
MANLVQAERQAIRFEGIVRGAKGLSAVERIQAKATKHPWNPGFYTDPRGHYYALCQDCGDRNKEYPHFSTGTYFSSLHFVD